MDWSWIYATLFRTTGWTYNEARDQPACVVFDFLKHMSEYPSADVVLRAVHLKPKPQKKQLKRQEVAHAATSLFGNARRMPQSVRDLVAWEESLGG